MSSHAALAHHFESLGKQTQAQRLGMWLFLATELLLFTALFAAYASAGSGPRWPVRSEG